MGRICPEIREAMRPRDAYRPVAEPERSAPAAGCGIGNAAD